MFVRRFDTKAVMLKKTHLQNLLNSCQLGQKATLPMILRAVQDTRKRDKNRIVEGKVRNDWVVSFLLTINAHMPM